MKKSILSLLALLSTSSTSFAISATEHLVKIPANYDGVLNVSLKVSDGIQRAALVDRFMGIYLSGNALLEKGQRLKQDTVFAYRTEIKNKELTVFFAFNADRTSEGGFVAIDSTVCYADVTLFGTTYRVRGQLLVDENNQVYGEGLCRINDRFVFQE